MQGLSWLAAAVGTSFAAFAQWQLRLLVPLKAIRALSQLDARQIEDTVRLRTPILVRPLLGLLHPVLGFAPSKTSGHWRHVALQRGWGC